MRAPRTVAVAILGADALLAAQPATPVQIAHACRQAGFDTAVPVCWGDELVAAETLHQLRERGGRPAIFCACPLVTDRLLAKGPHLAPFMVATVSPPVATARYVRRMFESTEVRITYVGSCPGARDEAIDECAAPQTFLDGLAARGIDPNRQPLVFDSVIPPDRRRHFSVAGGLPAAECLTALDPPRTGVEITVEDFSLDLAQHLIAGDCTLLDVAPRLGCACSGWRAGTVLAGARSSLSTLEPPRSTQRSVVDLSLGVDVSAPLPIALPLPAAPAPRPGDGRPKQQQQQQQQQPPAPAKAAAPAKGPAKAPAIPAEVRRAPDDGGREERVPLAADASQQRRKGAGGAFFRAASATAVPRARSGEGPALPRAYVARRRTPAGGARAIRSRSDEPLTPALGPAVNAAAPSAAAAAPPATPPPPSAIATPPEVPALAMPPAPAVTAVADDPAAAATTPLSGVSQPAGAPRKLHTPRSVGSYAAPVGVIVPLQQPAPTPVWRTPLAAAIGALILLTLLASILALLL